MSGDPPHTLGAAWLTHNVCALACTRHERTHKKQGRLVYFNKRTGKLTTSKPLTYNDHASELLEFTQVTGKDGVVYTVRDTPSGDQEYLDFETGRWEEYDDDATDQDDGAIMYRGGETVYHTSEVTNVFFVDEHGEYAFVPCSFLATNGLIKQKILEVQEWRPTWTDDVEIVMVLQICGYHSASAMVYAEHNSLGLTESEKYSGASDERVTNLEEENARLKAQLDDKEVHIAGLRKDIDFDVTRTLTLTQTREHETLRLEGNLEEQNHQLQEECRRLREANVKLKAQSDEFKTELDHKVNIVDKLKASATGETTLGVQDATRDWRRRRSSFKPHHSRSSMAPMREDSPTKASTVPAGASNDATAAPSPAAVPEAASEDGAKAALPEVRGAPPPAAVGGGGGGGEDEDEDDADACIAAADETISSLEEMVATKSSQLAAALALADEQTHEIAQLHARCAADTAAKENDPIPGMLKHFKTLLTQFGEVKASLEGDVSAAVAEIQPTFTTAIAESKKIKAGYEAASVDLNKKYMKEMALRKQYYNTIQELKGNIRVFVRVRKDNRGEYNVSGTQFGVFKFPNKTEAMIQQVDSSLPDKKHEFARVYNPDATQEEVFVDTSPVIMSVIDGYNVCIMAYGQTGSGKTFTMMGPVDNPGVNRRAIQALLQNLDKMGDTLSFELEAAQVEIYNEGVYDLLSTAGRAESKLKVRQLPKKIELVGLVKRPVKTMDDALKVMTDGDKNRSVTSTKMNSASSRSHLIFMITVKTTNLLTGAKTDSLLTLVDLAGSERVAKSEVSGDGLKEAAAINKSLSALGMVFGALGKKSPHIPYKNSALTHVLSDSLGGQAKCAMFINCSPLESNLPETISSLRFAENIGKIELGKAQKKVASGDKKK